MMSTCYRHAVMVCFGVILCVATTPAPATGQKFDVDMSAIDLFWNVTEILSRDQEPDSATWRALFASPGYAALKNDERIRSNIELVFRPSNAQQLQKVLAESNYWRRRDLEHLINVRRNREKLITYQKNIDVDAVIRQGIREAARFLPPGAADTASAPPIRFIIFGPDARVMGGRIMFDLAFTHDLGFDLLAQQMGHEFHHYFMGDGSRFKLPEPTNSYYNLARAIRQLQVEGIADLIDKYSIDSLRADNKDWHEQWRVPFNSTTARLAKLDTLLVELNRDSTNLVAHGKKAVNELFPMGGHPNGNAMARAIVESFGRDAIISSLDNPFEFFRLYDQSARRSGKGHVFSAQAKHYLERLEEMLVRPK